MLKEFIDMWRSDKCEQLCNAITEFAGMIDDVAFVFDKAWESFSGGNATLDNEPLIRNRDIAINKRERAIRRLLAEHLSINPGHDVPGCLALMSIAKDAERMGDYSKNIFGLAQTLQGEQSTFTHMNKLREIQQRIAENLPKLKNAYANSNATLATEILGAYAPTKADCANILDRIFSEELSAREAAATALLSTYLRRITSHMGNIASGITYPLDKIDFVRPDTQE